MTRALLLLFILGASLNNLCGQVGVNARYNATQAPDWDLSGGTQITELPGSGLSYGIDYWFRLKDKRIEFTPELNYFSATVEPSGSVLLTTTLYSFFFNTNIYLLDLLNDCDCPTFSKQSGILQRGFFVQISPGLSLPQFEHDLSRINSTERNTGDLAFSVGAGLGFDIGIADLITVTPMADIVEKRAGGLLIVLERRFDTGVAGKDDEQRD